MLGSEIAALLPSVILHLIVTVAFATGAWFLISKTKPEWRIQWTVPVILGAAFSLYNSSATVIGLYQNQVLFRLQQSERAQQENAQKQQAAAQNDPKLQLKAAFLNDLDQLTGSNEAITPAVVGNLFGKYESLFPHGDADRALYASAVMGVYQCQEYFYEDALASFKSRKAVKSEERDHCEKADGTFFNRDKLIPADMAKGNAEAIELLAQRKPLTDGAGKSVDVSEDSIRTKLEAQMHRIDVTKRLFASAGGGPKPASAH